MLFKFSIGGYPGPFFHLEVLDGRLRCSYAATDADKPEVITIPIVANKKWISLIGFLSKQKWKERYIEEGIVDGTGWSLTVKSAAVHIHSSGFNAYPRGFKKFLRLLNEVTAEKGLSIG
jgi:hypothetical protein